MGLRVVQQRDTSALNLVDSPAKLGAPGGIDLSPILGRVGFKASRLATGYGSTIMVIESEESLPDFRDIPGHNPETCRDTDQAPLVDFQTR